MVLLDTGASFSLIPKASAINLGFMLNRDLSFTVRRADRKVLIVAANENIFSRNPLCSLEKDSV